MLVLIKLIMIMYRKSVRKIKFMEQRIIESANKYKEKANKLEDLSIDIDGEENTPAFVMSALIRLYLAKKLEIGLEKCQEFLNEDTKMAVFDAIEQAADAIEKASDKSFDIIDAHANENAGFSKMIDGLSVNSGENDLPELLLKLYKCEGIIRMAYRCAKKYPVYGISTGWERQGRANNAAEPEDAIMRDMGVDIEELLKIRLELIEKIGSLRKSKKL